MGVISTPRQPRDARSRTAQTSERHERSPGSLPITFTRLRISPKVRLKLECRMRCQWTFGNRRYVVRWSKSSSKHATAAGVELAPLGAERLCALGRLSDGCLSGVLLDVVPDRPEVDLDLKLGVLGDLRQNIAFPVHKTPLALRAREDELDR